MKLIRGQHNVPLLPEAIALTIGNFDGVHRGHQYVLQQLQQAAHQRNLAAGVMIFEPQPLEFFAPTQSPARLTSFYEKVKRLQAAGIDYLICLKFDEYLAHMPAQQFIKELLIQQLHTHYLLIGEDFRFGYQRAGDWELLQLAAAQGLFELEKCSALLENKERISSTRIRLALQQQDFILASCLLGREYSLGGRVKKGDQRGRQLGFPTANLLLKPNNVPLAGVFAVMVQLNDNDQYYQGVANIGVRPTVKGEKKNLEVYLLDFEGDLYGQHLRVYFKAKLRDEQHFASLALLQQQIQQDVNAAKQFFLETEHE